LAHKQTVNLTGETGGTSTYYDYNSAKELECRQTVTGECTKSRTTELSHYSYDKAGEQTAITPEHDTTGSTFKYNAAGELSAITPSGGSEQALTYSGSGQADLTAVGTTTLQNSLLGLTQETTGTSTNYYARTPNGLLVDQRTPAGKFTPLYDVQGDIIALVNSSGKAERTFHYGPYGENTTSEGTQTIPDPFGFKNGYRTPGGNKGETSVANGLYHYGQRYYDPTTGRWTQRDALDRLASPTQGDRFLFASEDPINLSDPTGRLSACGPAGAVLGFLAEGPLGAAAGYAAGEFCNEGIELYREGEEEESEEEY
jgi:RHS repeat-associated protein